jgi:hypothetical protein
MARVRKPTRSFAERKGNSERKVGGAVRVLSAVQARDSPLLPGACRRTRETDDGQQDREFVAKGFGALVWSQYSIVFLSRGP